MNPITRLFHPRDKPRTATDSMNGSAYTFFMGGSSSGKHVNERSAMQMTAVYAQGHSNARRGKRIDHQCL